jgi:hypothetical protein
MGTSAPGGSLCRRAAAESRANVRQVTASRHTGGRSNPGQRPASGGRLSVLTAATVPALLKAEHGRSDLLGVFSVCRYCGDTLSRARRPLEICSKCENSPLCDRCGHPRSEHTRVFVRDGRPGFNWRVGDFQTLTSSECDCEGFRPVVGALSEAAFAAATPDQDASAPILSLRVVGSEGHVEG